jgi:hypothetical protein
MGKQIKKKREKGENDTYLGSATKVPRQDVHWFALYGELGKAVALLSATQTGAPAATETPTFFS